MALACDQIFMVDDGNSSVSLPELPLLAVLPGTGGLTRIVDKRFVRRDRADFFCTLEEGIRGKKAVEWGLVDEVSPASSFTDDIRQRAKGIAAENQKIVSSSGVLLKPLTRNFSANGVITLIVAQSYTSKGGGVLFFTDSTNALIRNQSIPPCPAPAAKCSYFFHNG